MHGSREGQGSCSSCRKIRQERQGAPFFQVAIELVSPNVIKIYRDVAAAVDAVLQGRSPDSELRYRSADSRIFRVQADVSA